MASFLEGKARSDPNLPDDAEEVYEMLEALEELD